MLVFCSIVFYLGALLVISRVIRGLHQRDELMDETFMSVPGSMSGTSSPADEDASQEHHAVQLR
jgi:hypothetical protein